MQSHGLDLTSKYVPILGDTVKIIQKAESQSPMSTGKPHVENLTNPGPNCFLGVFRLSWYIMESSMKLKIFWNLPQTQDISLGLFFIVSCLKGEQGLVKAGDFYNFYEYYI